MNEYYLNSDEANEQNNIDTQNEIIVEHKPLYNKIYWFDNPDTEIGVLTSIYILLFLYCFTMVLFKIATLLKNKRW